MNAPFPELVTGRGKVTEMAKKFSRADKQATVMSLSLPLRPRFCRVRIPPGLMVMERMSGLGPTSAAVQSD